MFLPHFLLIFVLCYQNVLGRQKFMCNFDDSDCLTKSAKKTYEKEVNSKGANSPLDILYIDKILVNLPTLNYTAHNVTLSGMTSCIPELVRVNSENMSYVYHIACKHLIMEGLYEGSGEIESLFLDGDGDFKTHFYDYAFLFNGGYELFYDKYEKLHFDLKDYNLEIDARRKIVYDINNLFFGDKERSTLMHKYLNENWKIVDKTTSGPAMNAFMTLYFKNLNNYLKETPVEEIFNYEI